MAYTFVGIGGRILSCLPVLISLFIVTMPVMATPTLLYLDPAEIIGVDCNLVGTVFTLTIRVDSVTDLYLWVVTIEWDDTIIKYVSDAEGGCLASGGPTTYMKTGVGPGKVDQLTCSLLGIIPGVNVPPAPSDLATVTFTVVRPTHGTWITITYNVLADSGGGEMPHDVAGTYFECPRAVGGFWVPVDKVGLLAPYIGLASTILVGTVATVLYVKLVKRVKKKEE